MALWLIFTQYLQSTIELFSAHFGWSEALSIIVLTMLVRTLLFPLSLTSAYRMQRNKAALARIKPALDQLKINWQDRPDELGKRTLALYREHGITLLDRISLLNIGSQALFGFGIFQVLKRMIFTSRFLWVVNLGKPDYYLAALVGVLMLLGMALMPGATLEPSALAMMVIPVLISIVAVATMPSALGIYWATSNLFTVLQSATLRWLLAREQNQQCPH